MKETVNILYLATDVFKKGGIQRYARYQIQALKEKTSAKNIFVFSFLGKDKRSAFEEDIPLDYVGGGTSWWRKILFAAKAFIFAIKKKPDIVFVNHVGLSPLALFLKKTLGIPYSVNVYGLEIWGGLSALEKWGIREADAVVGDCQFILFYIKNNLNINLKKEFLLYDCVELKRFVPQKTPDFIYERYSIPQNKRLLVTIGRLDRDKGQETGIKALKYLAPDVFYVIVGDGIKRHELEELARREGVRDRVIFTGRVPEEDLVPLYNIGDVVLLISRFAKGEGEGLPLGLIEASACAKPIIAGDEDGSTEAVIEGRNGFVVSPHDFEGIVSKIKFLVNNPEEAQKLGERGRKYVEENFSYEAFRQNQWRILENI